VLEDKGLRNYGTDADRTEQAGQGSKEMNKKNNQIAHRRIVAGREILRKYGQNNNSPATGRGLGLIRMEQRLRLVNGTFSVDSQPEKGTTVHASVPLRSASVMRAAG